jgi:hypothetical protein
MAPITRSSLHGRSMDDQPRVSHTAFRIPPNSTDIITQQARDSYTDTPHDDYEQEDESMADDYGEVEDDDVEVGGVSLCSVCTVACSCVLTLF